MAKLLVMFSKEPLKLKINMDYFRSPPHFTHHYWNSFRMLPIFLLSLKFCLIFAVTDSYLVWWWFGQKDTKVDMYERMQLKKK